jgi:NAD(P)-dependent dehydrogenase (short-subunit alcohol dehydrogenase family)
MKMTPRVFLREQFATLPKPASYAPPSGLAGKTIVITGANIGLGYEAALHMARLHPGRLILACRDERKGRDAAVAIRRETGENRVEAWVLDIASKDSVKAFAERYAKEGGGKLDILVRCHTRLLLHWLIWRQIENAGVNVPKLERTVDGWEKKYACAPPPFLVFVSNFSLSIGTNHLGTSHLAFRMLPYLLQAPQPRLVILASDVHYLTAEPEHLNRADALRRLNQDAPGISKKFDTFNNIQRYDVSKSTSDFLPFAASPTDTTALQP